MTRLFVCGTRKVVERRPGDYRVVCASCDSGGTVKHRTCEEAASAAVRDSNKPYRWSVGEAELEKVANVEVKMPRDYITPDGFGITDACRRYLSPLIQGEDYPPYVNGLPQYVKLKNTPVEKKLAAVV